MYRETDNVKNIYEIDIRADIAEKGSFDVTISGDDLTALEACILPVVNQICKSKGYKGESAYITIDISLNGEYYDHEEDEFEWVLIES